MSSAYPVNIKTFWNDYAQLRTVLAKAERQDAKAVRIYRGAVPSSELSLSQGEECILSKAEAK